MTDVLSAVPWWLPWALGALGALLVAVLVARLLRRRLTARRKTQQEMSRLRAFAAIHETRANDLSVKIDQQQVETASLGERLKRASATIESLREELAGRPESDHEVEDLVARLGELEAENARLGEESALDRQAVGAQHAELDRLRNRIDELEASNAELVRSVETAGGGEADTAELIRLRTKVVGLERAKADLEMRRDELMLRISAVADIDVDGMRERISRLESENAQLLRATAGILPGRVIDLRSDRYEERSTDLTDPAERLTVNLPDEPDLDEAARVLGSRLKRDDLKAIGGIGPKIENLCHGIGISTWRALADADPSQLHVMLEEAGPRYRMHDPALWTRQAELLATGRWDEFQMLMSESRTRRNR